MAQNSHIAQLVCKSLDRTEKFKQKLQGLLGMTRNI